MKILLLIDTFYPVIGGITTVVDKTATLLSEYADVIVGAVKAKNYTDEEKKYKILRCNGYYSKITKDGFAFPKFDKEFVKTIVDWSPDIIHVHTAGNLMSFAYKLRRKLNVPVVATIHTEYYQCTKDIVKLKSIAKLVTGFLIKKNFKSNFVWTVSQTCKKQVLPYIKNKQVEVVYNGTDLADNEKYIALANEFKKENNLDGKFIMSFVARMVKLKNIDLIIDAMEIINRTQEINAKIILVGDGLDKKYFEDKVKNLGLEKYFMFTGMIRDREKIATIYKASNLILFPSVCETSGLTQIEAAAFSKPTLAIQGAAPSEAIVDGENGLTSQNTAQDYADKILQAYNNRADLESMGKNANQSVYISYNEDYANKLMSLYQSYIDEFKNTKNN